MSESYREQHPLLCDDVSEEEHSNPHYTRRFRPMVYRGRARNQAKGAANIINQWPEYWTTSVTHWWIGLGMITLTVFIIYNSVIALAFLPTTHSKPIRLQTQNKLNSSNGTSSLPEVFMHILVTPNEEVDFNNYLPYIEIIAKKYMDFRYNLIVILNDTANDVNSLSAEENNEIAFNSLWSKEHVYENPKQNKNNIVIKYVTLSDYMNGSPLKKHWRHIPQPFIEFLVRAVSIWDKGGIAFNPTILTPRSPHPIYPEKVEALFQKYKKCNEHFTHETKINKHFNKQKDKLKKKVNNIQDIIDILEHSDDSYNSSQYSPTEAETKDDSFTILRRKLLTTEGQLTNNKSKVGLPDDIRALTKVRSIIEGNETGIQTIKKSHETLDTQSEEAQPLDNNKTSKLSLLPLFLEFLFRDKSKINFPNMDMEDSPANILARQRKSIIPVVTARKNVSAVANEAVNKTKVKHVDDYKPLIISAKGIVHDQPDKIIKTKDVPVTCENVDQITIDLKGNMIATSTPCHAFIGTLFSNVSHHTEEETINDFIISELSIFCKGILSSCKGIDVILL